MLGDLDLAARVMGRLGYSPEQVTLARVWVISSTQVTLSNSQISVAGRDGANYQGVGCPHPAANIQEGKSI